MLQNRTILTSLMTITNECIFDNAVAHLFKQYIQSTQPVPSTKVQASSVTVNTIWMTYQLTGSLHTGP